VAEPKGIVAAVGMGRGEDQILLVGGDALRFPLPQL
jgi:hypothetical protein